MQIIISKKENSQYANHDGNGKKLYTIYKDFKSTLRKFVLVKLILTIHIQFLIITSGVDLFLETSYI